MFSLSPLLFLDVPLTLDRLVDALPFGVTYPSPVVGLALPSPCPCVAFPDRSILACTIAVFAVSFWVSYGEVFKSFF